MKTTIVIALALGCISSALSQIIPVRVEDGPNPDLMVMTLGDVRTPLAQGTFNMATDEVRLADGRTIASYMKEQRGIRFYRPIDKSIFPLPPSGWCSWYYYYQDFDEGEIRKNAEWMGKNLKPFGATVVQIDDGWQGVGRGLGENRDWSTIDKRFPSGMQALAGFIKKQGMVPGLWLAPHGQSNEMLVRSKPGAFLLRPDDSSASNTWEGSFLVDPSTAAGHRHLADMFRQLRGWGYKYFKIDGQPIVVNEYRTKRQFMRSPGDPDSLYRSTLATIRSVIGDSTYLLGCWGIPLEGGGIMNGSRTAGDVVLGWSGFREALASTMNFYFLHNILWYCDPDVMLVRAPLTMDQARAWATLQGLTGQALMASDRMPDLSGERVELLKRVYPAVDIRPLDLFPSSRSKRVWDLKVAHLGRSYDVVGVFNYDEDRAQTIVLRWADLGLPADAPVHVFDFWNAEYLGAWDHALAVTSSPTSCRVLTLVPDDGTVQLVSTSRHISQGWVDLNAYVARDGGRSISGRSSVVAGDPYELRFAYPRGKNFRVRAAQAGPLPVTVTNHQGWASVRFTAAKSGEVSWAVTFEEEPSYRYPVRAPHGLSVRRVGLTGVDLSWEPQYYLNAGYRVSLNGSVEGYALLPGFAVRGVNPDSTYTVDVRSAWSDGSLSTTTASTTFRLRSLLPKELWLSEIEPASTTIGWGSVATDRAVSGAPMRLGGAEVAHGIGTHASSEIAYDVRGIAVSFDAEVGVDENTPAGSRGSVEFIVVADGRDVWRSGVMKRDSPVRVVSVPLDGVQRLVLRVTDAGDGIDYDHADWANARLTLSITSTPQGR